MNDISLKVYQVIEDKLGVDNSVITLTANFYNDLAVDSLDFCEFIVDIERAFNLTVPDEMFDKLKTVGSLVNYIAREKGHVVARELTA